MITDWAGNEIKTGMEVAFLQTVIHHWGGGILWPAGSQKDGVARYEETSVAHDEECWILGEFRTVHGSGDDLYVIIETKSDWPERECTISSTVKLGVMNVWTDRIPVVAIKGLSDKNPNA